ncbi:MAG: hypothetical protein IPK23_12250 [Rhizobiales bacterium]|nr:hypothetical protein [Hyphomicrobiales bacterium]
MALAAGIFAAASNASAQNQDLGEVARFFAGMSVPADSPVGKFAKDPAWQNYAKAFDTTWDKIRSSNSSRFVHGLRRMKEREGYALLLLQRSRLPLRQPFLSGCKDLHPRGS